MAHITVDRLGRKRLYRNKSMYWACTICGSFCGWVGFTIDSAVKRKDFCSTCDNDTKQEAKWMLK